MTTTEQAPPVSEPYSFTASVISETANQLDGLSKYGNMSNAALVEVLAAQSNLAIASALLAVADAIHGAAR